MIRNMLVRAAMGAAIIALAAGPAQAMDGRAFSISFYSDASLGTQVGFARAACNPEPVAVRQWGTSTNFQVVEYVGECIDGVLYYD